MVIAAGDTAEEDRHRTPSSTPTTAAPKAATVAMLPEGSRSHHKFSTLPCFNVKWGRQKQLRCVKDSAADQYYPTSSSSPHHHHHHRHPRGDLLTPDRKRRSTAAAALEDDGGIVAMREKLIFDLRTEVHQMKAAILSGGGSGEGGAPPPAPPAAAEARPWNLRTRRAVCKDPNKTANNNTNGNGVGCDRRPSFSPPSKGGEQDGDGGFPLKGPRAKFTASLSKQEIEEDFLAVMGIRPARRPRKRPRHVQKQIDALFPGYWLSEITADMYKVNENHEAGKR